MTSKAPATRRAVAEELSHLVRSNSHTLAGWACLIVVSLIAFWLTERTPYHQLVVGILMSSSTLLILMAVFECLWRLSVDPLSGDDNADDRGSGA
ncbi:MAG TPA: hypothetical protein VKR55_25480 [Bradyrhizobium sp.]|uniref:hypothetical protein n=1 Tax=Bradyrhizobium sp. TaxID=376 RepID=UPI002C8F49D6|nr:hypothetical protein [Bradyrhizobium sp.]HLZ05488.1 hypothetical protein [Bradyrhizobium sp.]